MKLTLDITDLDALVDSIADRVAEKLAETMAASESNGTDNLRLLTEAEAAARLGMAPHQLRDHRFAGRVKETRKGRRIYYSQSELRRFARCGGDL
jgi:hypothetical protein